MIKIQPSLQADPAKTSDWLLLNYRCLSDRLYGWEINVCQYSCVPDTRTHSHA